MNLSISLDNGVRVNEATVTLADVAASNGVVHVINAVLVPGTSSVESVFSAEILSLYPNPAQEQLNLNIDGAYKAVLYNQTGAVIMEWSSVLQVIDIKSLNSGMYFIRAEQADRAYQGKFIKQ